MQRRFSKIKHEQSIHLQELVPPTNLEWYAVCLHVLFSLAGFIVSGKCLGLCYIRVQAANIHERKNEPMHEIRIIGEFQQICY